MNLWDVSIKVGPLLSGFLLYRRGKAPLNGIFDVFRVLAHVINLIDWPAIRLNETAFCGLDASQLALRGHVSLLHAVDRCLTAHIFPFSAGELAAAAARSQPGENRQIDGSIEELR